MFNALLTLLPQILCPYGYTDVSQSLSHTHTHTTYPSRVSSLLQKATGLWGSLMIFSGMIGAFLAGLVIDFTKAFKEVAVVSYSLAILAFIWFYEVK